MTLRTRETLGHATQARWHIGKPHLYLAETEVPRQLIAGGAGARPDHPINGP